MIIKVREGNYKYPEEVDTPRGRWNLRQVLYDGGADGWSVAEGTYDGETRLAIRWNGNLSRTKERYGFPVVRGKPVWFMVPDELENAIRRALRSIKD